MSAYSAVGLYERVTFAPEDGNGKTSRVILRDVRVSTLPVLGEVLTGIEVNREAEDVHGRGYDERSHMISTLLIVKRTPLAMDNHTGLLVEAPKGDT